MNELSTFEVVKQFNVRFEYNNRLFTRNFTVPNNWTMNNLNEYLKLTFKNNSLYILNTRQELVYSIDMDRLH